MRSVLTTLMVTLATLSACGGSKSMSVDCSDVVASPGGLVPRACVHQVPNGATISETDGGGAVVSVDGKVITTYPPCACIGAGIGAPQCTDRNGLAHASGRPWSDGCMVCSCGDLGDGKLSPVCSHNACSSDASATDGSDHTVNVDPRACTTPIDPDAGSDGVETIEDLPIGEFCDQNAMLSKWTCHGSIVVPHGHNVDCVSYWVFDEHTGKLQATADGCILGPFCTGSVAGFQIPSGCLDGTDATNRTMLCTSNRMDAGDAPDGSERDSSGDADAGT